MALRDFHSEDFDNVRKEKSRGIVGELRRKHEADEKYVSRLIDGSGGRERRRIVFIHSLLENLDFSRYLDGIDIMIRGRPSSASNEFENFLNR